MQNSEKKETSSDKKAVSSEFLLTEFNALQQRAISLEEVKSSRVNFFLIVVAATIAGFSGIAGLSTFQAYYPVIIMLGSLILLLLGISTLNHSVDYSAAIVVLYRRAARVRRWFVDHNPEIEPYVAFEPNDDRPRMDTPYLSWRGGEAVILVANAVSSAIIVGIGLSFLLWFWIWVGVVVMIPIAWLFQLWYIHRKLRLGDQSEEKRTHFAYQDVVKKV